MPLPLNQFLAAILGQAQVPPAVDPTRPRVTSMKPRAKGGVADYSATLGPAWSTENRGEHPAQTIVDRSGGGERIAMGPTEGAFAPSTGGVDEPWAGYAASPIQTTIYRADPGTRQFVFRKPVAQPQPGVDLSSPGARARLEDQLAYQRQLIDAMTGAGASLENSPQFASMLGAHQAGMKSLTDQAASEAQQTQAEAMGKQADVAAQDLAWRQSPEGKKFLLMQHPEAMGQFPLDFAMAGANVPPEMLLGRYGYKPGDTLDSLLANISSRKLGPLHPGVPGQAPTEATAVYDALMASPHGSAYRQLLAGGSPYGYGNEASRAWAQSTAGIPPAATPTVAAALIGRGSGVALAMCSMPWTIPWVMRRLVGSWIPRRVRSLRVVRQSLPCPGLGLRLLGRSRLSRLV